MGYIKKITSYYKAQHPHITYDELKKLELAQMTMDFYVTMDRHSNMEKKATNTFLSQDYRSQSPADC